MVAGVDAVLGLREVEPLTAVESEQLVVPATDHEHPGIGGEALTNEIADPVGEHPVARALASSVWPPGGAPLLSEAPLVRLEYLGVLARGNELAEGGLAEVVDEDVVRTPDVVPGPPRALGVVVVLEEPDLVALVEGA